MGTVLHLRAIQSTEPRSQTIQKAKSKLRDSRASLGCGRLSVGGEVTNRVTIFTNRDVIRDSAVQLGLTHQRGASGVDLPGRIGGWFEGRGPSTSRVSPPGPLSHDSSACAYLKW
jgi:hypothetical protein